MLYTLFLHTETFYRFHAIHLLFTAANFILSITYFKKLEKDAVLKQIADSQLESVKTSFRILKHDMLEPYNRLVAVSGMIKFVKKSDDFEKYKDKIETIHSELNKERDYIASMAQDTEELFDESSVNSREFAVGEFINAESINVFNNFTSIPKFKFELNNCHLKSDPQRLLRVFRNLVKNALKATDGDTTISISCINIKKATIFKVHNTNSKIPANLVDKIFDPYVSTGKSSMGLGLFICKLMLHKLNGQIGVENVSDGVEFTISISE